MLFLLSITFSFLAGNYPTLNGGFVEGPAHERGRDELPNLDVARLDEDSL